MTQVALLTRDEQLLWFRAATSGDVHTLSTILNKNGEHGAADKSKEKQEGQKEAAGRNEAV